MIAEEEKRYEEAALRAAVEKTRLNLMSVELKQFWSLTSATSAGSANSMSTHWQAGSQFGLGRLRWCGLFMLVGPMEDVGMDGFLEDGKNG
jgi:hypothetical protein